MTKIAKLAFLPLGVNPTAFNKYIDIDIKNVVQTSFIWAQ
jgi:hypothetical protein